MKFICLGYFDKALNARPKAEIAALMQQCPPHLAELYGTGRVIMDSGLEAPAVTVRMAQGKLLVTDGPFAETKEQLGGVLIIEARDREEAIQLASRHPAVRMSEQFLSGLEIHVLHTFTQP